VIHFRHQSSRCNWRAAPSICYIHLPRGYVRRVHLGHSLRLDASNPTTLSCLYFFLSDFASLALRYGILLITSRLALFLVFVHFWQGQNQFVLMCLGLFLSRLALSLLTLVLKPGSFISCSLTQDLKEEPMWGWIGDQC